MIWVFDILLKKTLSHDTTVWPVEFFVSTLEKHSSPSAYFNRTPLLVLSETKSIILTYDSIFSKEWEEPSAVRVVSRKKMEKVLPPLPRAMQKGAWYLLSFVT